MDTTKFNQNDYLMGGGALVIFISAFFPWYSYGDDFGFFDLDISGFDAGWRFWLPFLLALLTVAAGIVPKFVENLPELPFSWAILTVGLGVATAVFMVLGFLAKPSGSSWSFGVFVALAGAAASVVGSVFAMQQAEDAPSQGGQQPPQPF